MMMLIWCVIFILTVIAEFATQQLVSIWFAAGSLVAFIVSLLSDNIFIQALLFITISGLLLIFARPILKKIFTFGVKDTNIRQDIGKFAVVIQEIDNERDTGRARLNDVDWIAVSSSGEKILEGTVVQVKEINGAKLFVCPAPQKEMQKILSKS